MTDEKSDVTNPDSGQEWIYSETVREHFFKPRNFLVGDPKEGAFNGVGVTGSPACGDVMRIWIKVDEKTKRITDMKWKTFGCASAIAATSMFSVMIIENGGRTIDEALKITSKDITERLEGLPTRKIHCSVLADKAFRKAVDNYLQSQK